MEAETLRETVSDAHVLVKSLADPVAEEDETPVDTRGDAQALFDSLCCLASRGIGRDARRHTE